MSCIKKIKYLFVYTDTKQLYTIDIGLIYDISKERNEYSFLYVFEIYIHDFEIYICTLEKRKLIKLYKINIKW